MNKVFINAAIIIIGFPSYSHQTVEHVNDCPKNEQSWKQRSSIFQCDHPNEEYHCLQNIEHDLIETCMKVYNIPSYKVGCPWVKIHNGRAYLRNPFTPCDPMDTGCPQQSHRKYRSNELYIYPECIKSGIATTSVRTDLVTKSTSFRTSTEGKLDGVSSIPLSVSLVILLGCMVFISIMVFIRQSVRGKNLSKRCSTVKNENICKEEVKLLSDSSINTIQKPADIGSHYAERSETDINVSGTTSEFKNSSTEKAREPLQHSVLVNTEINTATGNEESISKTSSTGIDGLIATARMVDEIQDMCPVVTSSDDEITPLVQNKRPNKRKRYDSEPITSININSSSKEKNYSTRKWFSITGINYYISDSDSSSGD